MGLDGGLIAWEKQTRSPVGSSKYRGALGTHSSSSVRPCSAQRRAMEANAVPKNFSLNE